ncbi:MAG TPA: phosphatase PAP2 family protein [Bryobacteraceae bacterium]|nr:phosphatase PAP2 family protein [Bryobacteraceae bacterium]
MTARFWAVDKVILAYFAFTAALELIWFRQISDASELLAWHVVGTALILAAAFARPRPGSTLYHVIRIFRSWYPVLVIACSYREMATLIPAVRQVRFDQALAKADLRIWGVYPTVWMERIYSPILTEYLQIIYTLFIPIVFLVPAVIWMQGRAAEFRYMAFLITLGFLISYVGYLMVPARGPRFLLDHAQHVPLQGLWYFRTMQAILNQLEHAHYDCFPSGHTEITVLAFWLSRAISPKVFGVYFLYTLCIVFATVYLRYHYTADLLAGVLVAVALILAAPRLYRGLSEKGESIGD